MDGSNGSAGVRRRRNRRGQGERLRDEVVAAAGAILAESGDAGRLSLRGVAKRVGIAPTSVYLHFPDVEHLAAAVAARAFADLGDALAAAGRDEADPSGVLLARCRAYCRFALERPGHYRVMFQVERPDLATAEPFSFERSPGRPAFDPLARDIARCQEAGAASPHADPTRLAVLVWASLHGLVSLRISRPRFLWPPLDELVDYAVGRLVGLAQHSPDGVSADGHARGLVTLVQGTEALP